MKTVSSSSSSPPFTVTQWQELEHQALIFKYLMAGLSVPPDLVLPVQKSFDSISASFFHHPTIGYGSYYGKKMDPEPGRCKRTDGKKWRCAKDVYPDARYCERHMNRGRNRSRKPVESPIISPSPSTITPLTPTGAGSGRGGGITMFQNLPIHGFGNAQGNLASGANHVAHYNLDNIPFGIPNKDYRHIQGSKAELGDHSFFSKASAAKNPWPILASRASPQSFPSNEFVSGTEPAKQEVHSSLRPFFDEWPKARDSWSCLDDDSSNQASCSTTQLSISIPMASSDFSATSSHSP